MGTLKGTHPGGGISQGRLPGDVRSLSPGIGQVIGQGGLTSRPCEWRCAGPGPVAEQGCWTVGSGEVVGGHEGTASLSFRGLPGRGHCRHFASVILSISFSGTPPPSAGSGLSPATPPTPTRPLLPTHGAALAPSPQLLFGK